MSYFTGPLRVVATGAPKSCDDCGVEPATWMHRTRRGGQVYLCFGCGDH